MTNTTIEFELTIDGVVRQVNIDEARRVIGRLWKRMDELKESALQETVRVGAALIEARTGVRRLGAGYWGEWLEAAGFHRKRAERAISMATRFADARGILDTHRLFAVLHAYDPETFGSMETFRASDVPLRTAIAASSRPRVNTHFATRVSQSNEKPLPRDLGQMYSDGTPIFEPLSLTGTATAAGEEDDGPLDDDDDLCGDDADDMAVPFADDGILSPVCAADGEGAIDTPPPPAASEQPLPAAPVAAAPKPAKRAGDAPGQLRLDELYHEAEAVFARVLSAIRSGTVDGSSVRDILKKLEGMGGMGS